MCFRVVVATQLIFFGHFYDVFFSIFLLITTIFDFPLFPCFLILSFCSCSGKLKFVNMSSIWSRRFIFLFVVLSFSFSLKGLNSDLKLF